MRTAVFLPVYRAAANGLRLSAACSCGGAAARARKTSIGSASGAGAPACRAPRDGWPGCTGRASAKVWRFAAAGRAAHRQGLSCPRHHRHGDLGPHSRAKPARRRDPSIRAARRARASSSVSSTIGGPTCSCSPNPKSGRTPSAPSMRARFPSPWSTPGCRRARSRAGGALPGFISALLGKIDLCLAQSEDDAARLMQLGAPRVDAIGNLKYDVDAPPADPARLDDLARQIGPRPIWIAASTHPGEEALALRATRCFRAHFPTCSPCSRRAIPHRGPGHRGGSRDRRLDRRAAFARRADSTARRRSISATRSANLACSTACPA